ncbi:MAG: hypothetical protein IPJ88_14530 [Myxococcales bacterium]|nr:MAG: hypothetical protein IPJ88_14530 [Myxococcales bacterium]
MSIVFSRFSLLTALSCSLLAWTAPTQAQTCGENVLNSDFSSDCANWDDLSGSDCQVNTEDAYGGSSPSNKVAQILGLPFNLDQNLSNLVSGQDYVLTFKAARRSSTPVDATVNINFLGATSSVTPSAADYVFTTYQVTVTASATTGSIRFTPGSNMDNVNGILIDDVSIVVSCDDALSCTTDSCSVGVCSNVLSTGCLISGQCIAENALNPANDCQACISATSTSSYSDLAASTACGDASDTDCSDPDTCDGAGVCLANDETAGVSCGDLTDDECANPDICNGTGVCLANDEIAGTACGDPTDDACTNPDTCDGLGGCLANHEMAGFACGSATTTECDNADSCDGAGSCQLNYVVGGTPCGDSSDTDCTDPNTCDGGGSCQDNHAVNGTLCGDSSDTVCTDPDSCLSGTCQSNHAVDGTACDDSNECLNGDQCSSGLCSGTSPVVCGSASMPVCEPSTGNCVECTLDDQNACDGSTPICDSGSNACQGCTDDAECITRFGASQVCDTSTGECYSTAGDAGVMSDSGVDDAGMRPDGDTGSFVNGYEGVAGGGGCDCAVNSEHNTAHATLWLTVFGLCLVRRRRVMHRSK